MSLGEPEISPACRESGNEEEIVRENLAAMQKAREIFIRNESNEKIKRALNKNLREHRFEDVNNREEVYYKRANEKEWRGPR